MRVLACFVILMNCIPSVVASIPGNFAPELPAPVATLDMAAVVPPGHGEMDRTTVAFASESSIAVGLCSKAKTPNCVLSLIRWEGGVLRPFAQTQGLNIWAHVNPASEGRVLATCYAFTCEPVLYSADLSTSIRLPSPIFVVSPSGSTVATITIGGEKPTAKGWKPTNGGWKIYRLSSTLEPIRDGNGDLRTISDEVVVIQDGTTMRTETLAGKVLGSFSVEPEYKCINVVEPLSDNRLYVSDCKSERIVDFNGNQQLGLHSPKGWSHYHNRFVANLFPWSANGSRMLFDYKIRDVSGLRNGVDIAVGLATLLEFDPTHCCNRQEVRVVDTVTGAFCFDWRQSFPMASNPFVIASISPSGEFLAIAAGKTLSIYRVPAVCGTQELRSYRE